MPKGFVLLEKLFFGGEIEEVVSLRLDVAVGNDEEADRAARRIVDRFARGGLGNFDDTLDQRTQAKSCFLSDKSANA
jgi:hypothetical protein